MENYVDAEGQAAWIAEHCDLPLQDVTLILDIEIEYMEAVGEARRNNLHLAKQARYGGVTTGAINDVFENRHKHPLLALAIQL